MLRPLPRRWSAGDGNDNDRVCLLCYDPLPPREGNDLDDLDDLEAGVVVAAAAASSSVPSSPREELADVGSVGSVGRCGHAVCQDCLGDYLRHCVLVGRVPAPCPSIGHPTNDCGTHLPDEVVRNALLRSLRDRDNDQHREETAWERYARLLVRRNLDDYQLPGSGPLPHPPSDDVAEGDDFDERRRQVFLESEMAVRRATRPCSHCGAALWKSGGCDHVVCPACHGDMCYQCGTHVHLSGRVIRSCSKCHQGYIDHRYNAQYRRRLLLCLPLLLPGWILYGIVAGALALLTGCFCGCFLCGWREEGDQVGRGGDDDDGATTDDPRFKVKGSSNRTAPSSPSSCATATTAQSSQTKSRPFPSSFAPWERGIRRTLVCVGLPVVAYLRDVGCNRAGEWLDDAASLAPPPPPHPIPGGVEAGASGDKTSPDIPIHPVVVVATQDQGDDDEFFEAVTDL